MKKRFRSGFLFIFLIGVFHLSFSQNIVFEQSNESGIYKAGEKIRVTLSIKNAADSVSVKIRKNYSKQSNQQKIRNTGNTILIYEETLNEPSSVIFEATTKTDTASIGLVVDPEKFIPATKRPDDFDQYWSEEKKLLRSLQMMVKSTPIKELMKGFNCADVEINCTGPKPVRGYYAKPEGAKSKSLPIVLYVHAAGVSGNWCRSEPGNALRYAKMEKGAICFDLNAHGMLNGQPEEYYTNLDSGELKNYAQQGLENRNDVYFRGMYLRLIRTLDFLTSQPEWDGKRILVIGESQGGGQALAAAGLDERVTAVVATVPAMCDWGESLVGRKGGWPNPFDTKNDQQKMLTALPYFDVAHMLKNSKATIVTEIGLIDFTCSSISVYAAINQARGNKKVFAVPYRAHHMSQPAYKEVWDKTVAKPKDTFIKDFLK